MIAHFSEKFQKIILLLKEITIRSFLWIEYRVIIEWRHSWFIQLNFEPQGSSDKLFKLISNYTGGYLFQLSPVVDTVS